ncbi:hypothetical protein HPP92_016532 [Vanilla planifolia]|uniref:Uncharacterized protein n=1 Tax=Vanilla planifolia TaxID=51239 RepID=A0A835QGG7_VANPL|nr:hypothetical protein HPP92_017131 [Vanilla planifolia]KAG0471986.1 hypothetical protein HPP92_016532 [Vanilla planifolia]
MGNVSDSVQEIRTEDAVDAGMKALHTFSFIVKNPEEEGDAEFSSDSSSIGADSSASSFEEGEDGKIKLEDEEATATTFVSLDSLEDSLPIKRGLSAFFSGKSKSFASLSDASASTAKDLAKTENPFNKRRRIQVANKVSWSRRASCSSLVSSPPEVKEEGEQGEREEGTESPMVPLSNSSDKKGSNTTFKPPRSLSLSDLQHGWTNLSSLL